MLAPGTYQGDLYAANVRGEPGRPILIAAADPARPPVIEGGGNGIQLSDPAHLELRGLQFRSATGNGRKAATTHRATTAADPRVDRVAVRLELRR